MSYCHSSCLIGFPSVFVSSVWSGAIFRDQTIVDLTAAEQWFRELDKSIMNMPLNKRTTRQAHLNCMLLWEQFSVDFTLGIDLQALITSRMSSASRFLHEENMTELTSSVHRLTAIL